MFTSIAINNFRGIRRLELNDLGRINLFVGKNNTGKTSILEACSMLALNTALPTDYRVHFGWVYKLLFDRNLESNRLHFRESRNPVEKNTEIISSAIYKRSFNLFDRFFIQGKIDDKTGKYANWPDSYYSESVQLSIAAQYNFEFPTNIGTDVPPTFRKGIKIAEHLHLLQDDNITIDETKPVFYFSRMSDKTGSGGPRSLDHDFSAEMSLGEHALNDSKVKYIKTNDLNSGSNALLYDKIIFDQEKLDIVLQALQIIEPDVEKFAYQANVYGERLARIKLKGYPQTLSINTMGDGINRILTIILSLVNCNDGYLVIDEFENGLHYSVQKQLWSIIFSLSELLNIQLFITTHSSDTIHSFASILEEQKDKTNVGNAIRLQRKGEDIIAVSYTQEELYNSTKFDIEIR